MFDFEKSSNKKIHALSPVHLLALIDISIFGLLSLQSGVFDPFIFKLGLAKAFSTYVLYLIIKKGQLGETYLMVITSMILTLGLSMQIRLSTEIGIKQFIWFAAGIAVFLITSIAYPFLQKKLRSIWLFAGLILGLFLMTQLLGSRINGAKNWIAIGGFSFQPSEFIKILFVFFMASFIYTPEVLRLRFSNFRIKPKWVIMGLVFIILGFFALQREFGTALLIFMVYLSMIYAFQQEIIFLLINIVVAGSGGLVAFMIAPHLQVRLESYLNPFADMAGKGYQITQSLFAIGSGGFFGTGIGNGYPHFIPNVSTDFIFSAICEETGIFGGIAVILLFLLLVYRGIKISLRLRDPFTKALAFGLSTVLGYQTFIIIGGVIRLIPLTGITLPFISYGGSSLLSSFIIVGLLQALSGPILKEEVAALEEIND